MKWLADEARQEIHDSFWGLVLTLTIFSLMCLGMFLANSFAEWFGRTTGTWIHEREIAQYGSEEEIPYECDWDHYESWEKYYEQAE